MSAECEDVSQPSAELLLLLGRINFAAYYASTGGLAFGDKPIPSWSELPDRSRKAWCVAAGAIRYATLNPPPGMVP